MPRIKKACENCGKEFMYYPTEHPKRIACSSKCLGVLQRKRSFRTCASDRCHKVFYPRANSNIYCSLQCANEMKSKKKIKRMCQKCGALFETIASRRKQKFCSQRCYGDSQVVISNPPNTKQLEILLETQSVSQIAALYEVSPATIRKLGRRLGVHIPTREELKAQRKKKKDRKYVLPTPSRRPPPPKEELAKLLKEKTTTRIASMYGACVTTVRRWCVELDLEDLRQEFILRRRKTDREKEHFPTMPLSKIGEKKCQNNIVNEWINHPHHHQ